MPPESVPHDAAFHGFNGPLNEQQAEAKLRRITPSNAELQWLAERHPPPQEWYDEEEVL